MADLYNIKIDAGADYSLVVQYKDSVGDPIDITSYDVRMFFKRLPSDVASEEEFTVTSGHLVIDGSNGLITLSITNSETAALSGTYFYDLELISLSNVVVRLIQGKAIISEEVTW